MNILDYCRIAWRARRPILGVTVAALVVALVAVLLQTKVYSARATILSPKESTPQGSFSLGAFLAGSGGGGRDGGFSLPSLLGGVPSMSTNQDMFAAILKSVTIRQEVAGELAKTYGSGAGSMIIAVDVGAREKGLISLTVEATDPRVAADAANLYFQSLDRIIERLAEQATRRQQTFYADQLQRAAKEVASAEGAVLKFQAENRVVPIDGPTRTATDAGGGLRGTIMSLEMQREVMRLRMTDQHPQMREIEKQIAELKKQYSKNLFGAPMDLPGEGPGQRGRKEFFVSTDKMTPVQFAYLKLYRNLKIQEAFYTGALQGLEQLKYNDGVQHVRVEPLDPAVPPDRPSRPRVILTLVVAAVGGLIASTLVVFIVAYVRRLLAEERALQSRAMIGDDRRGEAVLAHPDDFLMRPDPLSAVGRSRQ